MAINCYKQVAGSHTHTHAYPPPPHFTHTQADRQAMYSPLALTASKPHMFCLPTGHSVEAHHIIVSRINTVDNVDTSTVSTACTAYCLTVYADGVLAALCCCLPLVPSLNARAEYAQKRACMQRVRGLSVCIAVL